MRLFSLLNVGVAISVCCQLVCGTVFSRPIDLGESLEDPASDAATGVVVVKSKILPASSPSARPTPPEMAEIPPNDYATSSSNSTVTFQWLPSAILDLSRDVALADYEEGSRGKFTENHARWNAMKSTARRRALRHYLLYSTKLASVTEKREAWRKEWLMTVLSFAKIHAAYNAVKIYKLEEKLHQLRMKNPARYNMLEYTLPEAELVKDILRHRMSIAVEHDRMRVVRKQPMESCRPSTAVFLGVMVSPIQADSVIQEDYSEIIHAETMVIRTLMVADRIESPMVHKVKYNLEEQLEEIQPGLGDHIDRLIRGALGSVYALRHSPSGLLSIAEETKQQTEEREKGNIRGYVSHNDSPLATLPVTGEGTLNWVVVLETYTYLETRLSKFNMDKIDKMKSGRQKSKRLLEYFEVARMWTELQILMYQGDLLSTEKAVSIIKSESSTDRTKPDKIAVLEERLYTLRRKISLSLRERDKVDMLEQWYVYKHQVESLRQRMIKGSISSETYATVLALRLAFNAKLWQFSNALQAASDFLDDLSAWPLNRDVQEFFEESLVYSRYDQVRYDAAEVAASVRSMLDNLKRRERGQKILVIPRTPMKLFPIPPEVASEPVGTGAESEVEVSVDGSEAAVPVSEVD